MSLYPVALKRDEGGGGGFVATFRTFLKPLQKGETKEEALAAAREALETALDFYFDENREVPSPSAPKRGQPVVELPAFPPRLKPI